MEDNTFIFFLIPIFMIAFGIILGKKNNGIRESIGRNVNELNNKYDKVIPLGYENNDNFNYVAFDNTTKEILIKNKGNDTKIKYDDIVNVELVKNGKTTMSISNMVLGTVIAGGAGLVAGSLAKNEKITNFHLKFSLNNFNTPSHTIYLLNVGKTLDYGIDIETQANSIMDTVKYIIDNK